MIATIVRFLVGAVVYTAAVALPLGIALGRGIGSRMTELAQDPDARPLNRRDALFVDDILAAAEL